MAKPKPDLPPAEALRALADAEGRLAVRATPGARSEGITIVDGVVQVKVRVKPQDGAANDAVIGLLAKALGSAPTRLTLLRGATSREKLVQLD
tara:strand:- start:25536 stop:25814 length:279 start_codon:yes stop_codon:yes gene_type:complete